MSNVFLRIPLKTIYIQTKQNCKKGYKKCGVLDSMNHTLCVSNEAVCPINKLLIDQSATSPTDFKYTTLALDEGIIFIIQTRTQTEK